MPNVCHNWLELELRLIEIRWYHFDDGLSPSSLDNIVTEETIISSIIE